MPRLGIVLLVGLLAGCASTTADPSRTAWSARPGRREVDPGGRHGSVVRTFDLHVVREGGRQPVGTLTETVGRTPDGHLVRVQRLASPRGSQVDSLVSTPDLSPVSHYSRNPGRIVDLRYASGAVTGTYANTGEAPVTVDDDTGGPAFDSNVIDLVARAVPLTPGFSADVRTYERASADAADTEVTYRVRVVGRETVGDREAIVVEFSKPGTGATRLTLDPETREVLRQESEVAPGTTFVMEPS